MFKTYVRIILIIIIGIVAEIWFAFRFRYVNKKIS
jgi:hypothetical protein